MLKRRGSRRDDERPMPASSNAAEWGRSLGGVSGAESYMVQVRRLSHGRVVHAEVAATGPHNDVAGVQSDPDANTTPLDSPHLVGRIASPCPASAARLPRWGWP